MAVHRRATSEQRQNRDQKLPPHKQREATPCRRQKNYAESGRQSGTSQNRMSSSVPARQEQMGEQKNLRFREKPRTVPRVEIVPRVEAVAMTAARKAAAMKDLEIREQAELSARRIELQKLRECNAL